MSDPTPEDLFGRLLGKQDQTINVQMGGSGVWIAATAAIVSFVLVIAMGIGLGVLAYVVHAHSMQLNAIYQVAPSLREKVEDMQK
jgi:hypothetical protein